LGALEAAFFGDAVLARVLGTIWPSLDP